jgi:hypothetical protein
MTMKKMMAAVHDMIMLLTRLQIWKQAWMTLMSKSDEQSRLLDVKISSRNVLRENIRLAKRPVSVRL